MRVKSRVIGTLSAVAIACKVASDGEMAPFSTFESIPVEIPAAAPSSATVRSFDFRKLRISRPIKTSSRVAASCSGVVEWLRGPASEPGLHNRGEPRLNSSRSRIQATVVSHVTRQRCDQPNTRHFASIMPMSGKSALAHSAEATLAASNEGGTGRYRLPFKWLPCRINRISSKFAGKAGKIIRRRRRRAALCRVLVLI